jgi:MFS family permease
MELMTGLAELAASRPLIALGAVEAAILFVYGTVEVFLPLYALEQGIGAFEVGVCLSAQVVTLAATKPVMGRLSDRRGRSGQILWGSALGVLSAAGLSMSGHFILILLLSVLIGFSLSVVTASTSAAVADITRCEMRGSAMGIFGTLMDLGHSAGPMVSGMLAAWLGFGAAFIGAAIVLALAAAAFISTRAGQLDPCALGKPP